MEYIPTSTVFRVIGDQLAEQLAEHADSVIHYEGNVFEAIDSQFGQATPSAVKAVVLYGLADDIPDAISGSGEAIRARLFVDCYIIVRADGRSRHDDDNDRLFRISDVIYNEAFAFANTSETFRQTVASAVVQFRRRISPGDTSVYVQLLRFIITPLTP